VKKYLDLKLIKYLVIFYTIVSLLLFIMQLYWKSMGFLDSLDISFSQYIFLNIVMKWFLVILFMILVSYITKVMFEKSFSWGKILFVHLFLSLFIQIFIFLVSISIIAIGGDYKFSDLLPLFVNEYMQFLAQNFLIYFSMTGIIYVYYYLKKVKNIELQKAKLQANLADAKLSALKSQINPHFIFNTLNSISSLIEEDKTKSQNLIAEFGDFFRDTLKYKDQNLIPLKQELDLCNKYIDIVAIRFSDHLKVTQSIDPKAMNTLVPMLLLQPLIENSVKHGYSYNNTELIINLKITQVNNYLHICITNDGKLLKLPFIKLLEKGIGLTNIKNRLTFLYNDTFEFIVKNKKDLSGVETFVKIPLK